ncbi:E3 ubiquitin-protein ligase CCNB1IP1 [Struthio camelus]|uniref:E3 ubiquitin-protein ligase CCNB1IP1 n=1 Tax=Struthio camelus TaxID=8801 RepID=UPI003603E9C0
MRSSGPRFPALFAVRGEARLPSLPRRAARRRQRLRRPSRRLGCFSLCAQPAARPMAVCEDLLLCNYRKCRAKLAGYAWVTACSHIFCDPHGSGEFSRSPAVCPACGSALSGKLDIVRTELSPSEEYKAMVLAGLRPEVVLDISSRALAFWTYQVHQERLYQEYAFSQAEGRLRQAERACAQRLQGKEAEVAAVKSEVASLKRVLEEYKGKFTALSERLMERNRQYQKLQGLYDGLRLRNMAAAGRDLPASASLTGAVAVATPPGAFGPLFGASPPPAAGGSFFPFGSPGGGAGEPAPPPGGPAPRRR